jgi:hypothetical protein
MIEYYHPGFCDNAGRHNNHKRFEDYFKNSYLTGYLVSKAFEKDYSGCWKKDLKGARDHYDSHGLKIFGDSGAFSFVDEDVPPVSVNDVIDFYNSIGVDRGASLDHVVPDYDSGYDYFFGGLSAPQKYQDRMEITIENGSKFLEECKKQDVRFQPVGAVQGWSPNSYIECIQAFQKMGYKKIAIGGVAHLPKPSVIELLKRVKEIIGETEIHLFGLTQPKILRAVKMPNITSVDGMGPFISSVVSAVYFAPDEKRYMCIPLEDVNKSEEYEKIMANGNFLKVEEISDPETNFSKDRMVKTLKSRVWETCDCAICEEFGSKIVLHHKEYSRARGLHNMYMVGKQLRETYQEIISNG